MDYVNTAIFSLLEAVFLHSPAVRDPDRLVAIYSHNPKEYGIPYSANSYPDYVDLTVLSYGFWQHRFGSDPNLVQILT
ncbi:MAG TPA: hypothetical protein VMW38_22090 [Terriglobia bacterium]|nr:hypothetical protein [Terriglobia bacterium]